CACERVNLPSVQAEPLVGSAALRFDGACVREEHPAEATLEYCRGDAALGHIGEALGRKYDGRVLPPQRLQPLPDLRSENRVIEQCPSLVEPDQGGRAVEPPLDAAEEVSQHSSSCTGVRQQLLHLEPLHPGFVESVALGV